MSNSDGYNGHANYETWDIDLWIGNDEGLYNYWQERAQDIWDSSSGVTFTNRKDNAIESLAQELESYFDDEASNLVSTGPFSDLLTHALGQVDWREIAENLLEEIAEDDTDEDQSEEEEDEDE